MDKRIFGAILIILGIVLLFNVISYTDKLIQLQLVIHTDCPLQPDICPAHQTPPDSMIGYFVVMVLFILGIYNFILFWRNRNRKSESKKNLDQKTKNLLPEEKKIIDVLSESGAMFQSELVDKLEMDKVKVTRILDKLEGKGLVERKRRGMSNMVVLKG